MEERLIAFIIWAIMGVLFIVMGIYDINSKKAKSFGFIRWAESWFDYYTYIGCDAY